MSNFTFDKLVHFLYDVVFTNLMSFSESVLEIFSYSFEISGTVVTVGDIAYGALFVVFGIGTIIKWLPLSPD